MNTRICVNCKKEFEIENWELKYPDRGRFCSPLCRNKYPITNETRKKISESMKKAIHEGRASGVFVVGTSIRNSGRTRFKKGHTPWSKGKKLPYNAHPKMKGFVPWNKGKIGVMPIPWNKGIEWFEMRGEKHFAWKGGTYDKNRKVDMGRKKYREWRKAVFERDSCECIWCGSTKNLNADHIKSYALYPELRYELSNGRVLCETCHKTTETYGNKLFLRKEEYLIENIRN